ncbi:MAG TPA: hypothetical protein VGK74_20605 [Symbiobacteriaceae bacterium]
MLRLKTGLLIAVLLLAVGCTPRGTPPGVGVPTPPAAPGDGQTSTPTIPPAQGGGEQPTVQPGTEPSPIRTESGLPPIGFRPDLLVTVYSDRYHAELYGYHLADGRQELLTAGTFEDPPLAVNDATPSPDGQFVAYLRFNVHERAHGVCVRPISGGEPDCLWERWGDADLEWRPGVRDLWVLPFAYAHPAGILRITGGKLERVESPLFPFTVVSFSPNGRYLISARDGKHWLVEADHPQAQPRAVEQAGPWVNDHQVVVLQNKATEIGLLDISGQVTMLDALKAPAGGWIGDVHVSPGGRFVGVNYKRYQNALDWPAGSVIYDTNTKKATPTPGIAGWTNDDRWVVAGAGLLSTDTYRVVPFKQDVPGWFQSLSPDGDWVLYRGDEWILYQISTGQVRKLTTDRGNIIAVTWVPKAE